MLLVIKNDAILNVNYNYQQTNELLFTIKVTIKDYFCKNLISWTITQTTKEHA